MLHHLQENGIDISIKLTAVQMANVLEQFLYTNNKRLFQIDCKINATTNSIQLNVDMRFFLIFFSLSLSIYMIYCVSVPMR